MNDSNSLLFHDWGTLSYNRAWEMQTNLFQSKVKIKRQLFDDREKNKIHPKNEFKQITNDIIFVEHPPVFTLGKSGNPNHLLSSESFLKSQGFEYIPINRGGDITYHGPGQLVVYPILDLEQYHRDLNWYLRTLEQIAIDICNHYGLVAHRIDKFTGVWIEKNKNNKDITLNEEKVAKICAFGVKVSRWITMHGLAFNINTNLSHFNHIIPCGISDKSVTSLKEELGYALQMSEVKSIMKTLFIKYF